MTADAYHLTAPHPDGIGAAEIYGTGTQGCRINTSGY